MEKQFQKKKKGFAGSFPQRWPATTVSWPISVREASLPPGTASPMLTAETHLSGLSLPNPPLLPPAWQRRPNCRHQVSHLSPSLRCEDARVCACHHESSCQLWCTVVLHRRCPPAPAVARPCASWDAALGARR
jgi:hypothetical protein